MIDPRFITTANELHGYRVAQHCGVVRGIIVRSRSAIGNFAAGIQTFFGGNISLYTELCEQARQEAFDLMCLHAAEAGATPNASAASFVRPPPETMTASCVGSTPEAPSNSASFFGSPA